MKSTLAAALAALPGPPTPVWPEGAPFAEVLRHGSLTVELYVPQRVDRQTPHRRDELYVIVSGSGEFVREATRTPFAPHDVIFVPAGVVHRFEHFTADFKTWVIFHGPDGGENA